MATCGKMSARCREMSKVGHFCRCPLQITFKSEVLPSSVSVRIKKQDVYLHPDLEFSIR